MSLIDKVLRIGEGKIIRQLEAIAKAVNAIEDDFVAMSDAELQGMTDEFRERLANGRRLWWDDDRSVDLRRRLAVDQHLHGLAIWQIGSSGPLRP